MPFTSLSLFLFFSFVLTDTYKVKIITHNTEGIWNASIPKEEEEQYYSSIVKDYFSDAGNADIIIFNFQEMIEMKISSSAQVAYGTLSQMFYKEDEKRNIIYDDYSAIFKYVKNRIYSYFKHEDYDCQYLFLYYLSTIVCSKKEQSHPKVRFHGYYCVNEKIRCIKFGKGILGQKGGFITSIVMDDYIIFNVNLHLDSKKSENRMQQFDELYKQCNRHLINLKKEIFIPILFFNGDFNSRPTETELSSVGIQQTDDQFGLSYLRSIFKNKARVNPDALFKIKLSNEEIQTNILTKYSLEELPVNFKPTYKINKELANQSPDFYNDVYSADQPVSKYYYENNIAAYTDRFLLSTELTKAHIKMHDYDIHKLDHIFSDHLAVKITIEFEKHNNFELTKNVYPIYEVENNEENIDDKLEEVKENIYDKSREAKEQKILEKHKNLPYNNSQIFKKPLQIGNIAITSLKNKIFNNKNRNTTKDYTIINENSDESFEEINNQKIII